MHFIHSFIIPALCTTVLSGLVAIRSPVSTSLDVPVYQPTQERQLFAGLSLGSYDLSTSRQNTVLLDLIDDVGLANGGVGAGIKVLCISCRTWGQAIISTTGASKDVDIIGDIIDFFQDPEDAILDAFSVDLKLSLSNVGGHFEFDISALAALSYAIPIYQSLTPIGGAIGDDISIGIVLSVELVFSVTAGIDLTAGFDFSFPEDTYITVDPLTGEIKEDGFLDGSIDPLPITIKSGNAVFKAALKIKLQAGTTVELFGTGFDFQLGVFANVIEYVATISSTETCDLLITELLDVNIGAFAQSVVTFNFVAIGGSPPIITTILTIPLPSACITFGPGVAATSIPLISAGSITTSAVGAITTLPGGIFAENSPSSAVVVPTISVVPYLPTNNSTTSKPSSTSCSSTSSQSQATGTGIPHFPLLNTTISATIPDFTLSPPPTPSTTPGPSPYSQPLNSTHPLGFNTTTTQVLVTSTIYTTSLITLCSCAEPLINCPSSLTAQITLTSTQILYTTICTPGAILPSTLPATITTSTILSSPPTKSTPAASPAGKSSLHFVRLETPVVEVLYIPTRSHVSHSMPASISMAAVPTTSTTSAFASALGKPGMGAVNVKAVKVVSAPFAVTTGGLVVDTSLPTATGAATGGGFAPKVTFTGGGVSSFQNMQERGMWVLVLGAVVGVFGML